MGHTVPMMYGSCQWRGRGGGTVTTATPSAIETTTSAAFTMLLPIYFKTLPYLMFAFLLFEVCVGAFFPAMAVLRSKVLPSTGLSTIMNIFRVPLNIIVVSGTKATDLWTSDNVFLLCFACHAAALVCQFLMINAAAKQKKKQ